MSTSAPESGTHGSAPNPGARGPFELLTPLGQGQFGVVWKAVDTRTGGTVAIKTVRLQNAHEEALLKAEFRRMSGVSHPNLVFPIELTSLDGATALVMEYVQGAHFLDHLRGVEVPRRYEVVDRLLAQLATALEQIHGRGWVHRDVKPANILVTDEGRLVLIDHGFVESVALHGGDLTGTLAYVAPEVARREVVTPAADWYAVGTMLYEVLSGRLPFSDNQTASLTAKLNAFQPPGLEVAGAPPALVALTLRLLEPDPARRAGLADVRAYLGLDAVSNDDTPAPLREVFVGRDRELAALHAVLGAVRPGTPSIVHVHAQPGMGKTTLVGRWVASLASRPDVWILKSRCFERDATPYQALDLVIDAVAEALTKAGGVAALTSAGAVATLGSESEREALARCFPVLGAALAVAVGPSVDPVAARQLAFGALATLVTQLAGDRTIALWIDDLQWGDADSAELLEVLVAQVEAPLMLVISYRSDDREASEFLRAFAARERPRAVTVDFPLGPLDATQSIEIVSALAPDLTPAELEPIIIQAEGCPFLLEAIASARSVVGANAEALSLIDRSGPAELELLRMASISGRPLSLEVLLSAVPAALHGEATAQVTHVTHLRGRRLLRTSGTGRAMKVDLYHGRVRAAVLARLSDSERRGLHRRLADALIALGPGSGADAATDPEIIARHLGASDAPSLAKPYAVSAAQRAFDRLAFDRAAELFRLALDTLDGGGAERLDLMRSLAKAYENAGRGRDAGDTLLACARLSSDPRPLLRLAMDQYFVTGHFAAGMPLATQLLESVGMKWPRSGLRSRVQLVASFLRLLLMKRRTTPWSGPPPSPELRHRIELVTSLGRGLSAYDGVRGPAYMLEAARLSIRHGYDALATIGMGFLAFAVGLSGKPSALATAQKWLEAADALASAIDDRRGAYFATVVRGILDVCCGRWANARAALDAGVRGLEDQCIGVGWELATAKTTALHAYFYGGELRELGRRVEALVQEGASRGDIALELEAHFYRCQVYLIADQPRRAVELAARSLERWTGTDYGYQHWNAFRAETYARLYTGDVDEAFAAHVAKTLTLARRAGLLGMQLMRFESAYLEGRVAVALSRRGPGGARSRRQLARIARRLHKEPGCLPAHASAALFEAEGATGSAAQSALTTARAAFIAAGMSAHVAAIDHRLARETGDGEGLARAARALEELGIKNPAAFAAMLVG